MAKRFAGILLLIILFTITAKGQETSTKKIIYSHLSVKIRLSQTRVHNVNDLKLVMIVANNNKSAERFLFDKLNGTSKYPLATICNITDEHNKSVLQYNNMTVVDRAKYNEYNLKDYYYVLEPTEWIMKVYKVTDMVRFNEKICKNGKLPKGTYHLQVIFNNNPSNTITFEME